MKFDGTRQASRYRAGKEPRTSELDLLAQVHGVNCVIGPYSRSAVTVARFPALLAPNARLHHSIQVAFTKIYHASSNRLEGNKISKSLRSHVQRSSVT